MKYNIIALIIICFSSFSTAQNTNYDSDWAAVEKLETEGLTKSASEAVDNIFKKAKSEKNSIQIVKSLLYQSKYLQILEEDSQLKIIENFKTEIESQDVLTTHILENLLAKLYWQYYQNNRYKFYNRSKTDVQIGEDFRTWDLQTLFAEIHKYYQFSLQNGLILQQEPLEKYSALLNEVEDSKTYRPTLFDFLSHNALEFYQTTENGINQPAYKFTISQPEFIAPSEIFMGLNISSKDSVSLQLNALKIFQNILRFHQKDKTSKAYISTNIKRLDFVKQNATFNDTETKLIETYTQELEGISNTINSSLYSFEIANQLNKLALKYHANASEDSDNYRWKNKEALELCEAIINKFPSSDGAKQCEVLKEQILNPTLNLRTEKHIPVNKPSLVLVNYKNLEALDFKIYKVNKSKLNRFYRLYNVEEKSKFLTKLKAVKSFTSPLKNENDYQNHSLELVLPPLENGLYLISAHTKTDVFATADIQVTNLALLEAQENDTVNYQVINRNNGQPIVGASVEMVYTASYDRNDRRKSSFTTDKKGRFVFAKNGTNYYDVTTTINYNGETAVFGNYYINRRYDTNNNSKINYRTFIITDRSIYRPGQTVYFKGIAIKTEDRKTNVVSNEVITAELHDVNGQKLKELQFVTNEYGSFHGEFILPDGGLTGDFSINTTSEVLGFSSHYFSVEEYKRPKFKTEFSPVTETYKVNDSVTVKGNAIAFAGSTITDAKVVYRVKRNVQFPNWYYWRGPSYNSSEQEITFGETITNAKGEFEITFKALPDEKAPKDNLPVFSYEVTADVTDINGETRSATTIVRVGYHALTANIIAPQKINKSQKTTELSISTANLNGEYVPAKGTLQIYKLKHPEYVLRPRPWPAPDYNYLSEAEFKQQFAHWAYDNESQIQNWDKGKAIFETDFDTEKSKEITLKRIKNWESGTYLITLETKDKFGQDVKDQAYTFLYSDSDKIVADNMLFDASLDKDTYRPKDNAKLTFGTAAEEAYVTISVEKQGKLIDTQIHKLSTSKKQIALPINEADYGGFVVHYSFSFFNYLNSGSITVNVPYPKTDLQIETSTFRDKLQPGQDETWQFKIKGPKGDKVTAEVLASMYDASLDEFKSNDWNFSPIYRPNYNSRINTNYSRSFGVVNFRNANYFRTTKNYSYQGFDTWNWFGFYFGNESQARRAYFRNINSIKSKIISNYDDTIKDGTIKGIVTDFTGATLPGVNVIVKGTATGTQTDFDGKFEIEAKNDKVLVFSYVGMKTIEHKVDKYNKLQIILTDDYASLDEVVITGYSGAKKSAKVSSALATVSSEEARFANADNIEDAEYQFISDKVKLVPGDSTIIGAAYMEIYGVPTKQIQIRKNLQETAFFFPQLQTDKDGNVSFNFKAPEALTKWKLQLLAHTKTLESSVAQFEAVTQKELMVLPNTPRFLRQGDEITISTKIANLTDKPLSGQAQLILEDAVTSKNVTNLLIGSSAVETFSVDAKGNTSKEWILSIPDDIQAVQYKIIAQSEEFSDGEQNVLPVLTNRMLVTESLPMWVRSNQTKTFTLDKLANNSSSTLINHKLTLEITSNPAWYAVQALPYLMEYPYDCNEQTFSRYYANALAQHIVNSNPRIETVFNQWASQDALISNLEKNQELKSLLIEETPWLRDAQSETEQKKRIALLFDLNKMNNELQNSIRKLKNNQHNSGAWPWFSGGRDNRYITQHIISGFGHLKKLSVKSSEVEMPMIEKAINYLDQEFVKDYKDLKKYSAKVDLNKDHLSYTQLHYLYVRSFYPEIKASNEVSKIMDYYMGQIQKYWLKRSLYAKGLMALVSHRNQDEKTASKILKSLEENSITSEELGMYWKENTASWYWHQAPIETQALLIEAFSEIQNDIETIDNLKIWLLKNKQTNKWETTKATTEAVYALLLQGSEWLDVTEAVDVQVGTETISPSKLENVKVEAGTGYYKTSWNGSEINPEQSKVTLSKKGEGIAWGALYWQYFEDLDKITPAETPLKLKKKLFLKTNTDRGEEITEITKDTKLNVGDLVKVRIELRSDRDMEFLHLKDMRAAGFEPINVLSQYKWQDGLGYYESTKDAATNFFIDYLPKGVYVFEYDLRVNNSGDMSNGITTIQSMYAPEFSSHSEGIRVKVD
ncbi:alpha-2-macroglobulin family protein [Winogradskyella wandonensis]|uniref:Alpha-2-macroglobulin family protein n=1 Tax=Winogradskyella wandonensis TaxID=1442586 RepID=A0A4R1KTN9_9FLAO|nr:alpha-2-macroglobulin family protein [Winogradskyella wandonensis]TCK68546.1 alpha-2-macroglobulin family protein [Winogradskyella wandonensis]